MSFLLGSTKQPQAQQPSAAAGVNIQTSCYGKVIPVVVGTAKVAPNLIWYGAFQATAQTSSSSSGGGGKGGGGGGSSSTTSYTYSASFALCLCEGPIQGVGNIWVANSATATDAAALGMSVFEGSYPQTPWSYLTSFSTVEEQQTIPSTAPYTVTVNYPGGSFSDQGVTADSGGSFTAEGVGTTLAEGEYYQSGGTYTFSSADAGRDVTIGYTSSTQEPPNQAMAYPGFAYLGAPNYDLGDSASLPNHNVETSGFFSNSVAGSVDADPSMWVPALLTNPYWGLCPAFPSSLIGNLSLYQSYCLANGLLLSVAYTEQASAASSLGDIATYTNSDVAWTGSTLNIIPRGDQAVTANGVTYMPPAFTFALTDADVLPQNAATSASGSSSSDPLLLSATRPQDAVNIVALEYIARANGYNPETVQATALAEAQLYGRNQSSTQSAHLFAEATAARLSAQLILQRGQILNTWQVTVGEHCVGIDIGDLGTITNARHGLINYPVRVTEITEQSDSTLLIAFEDYPAGIGTATAATGATGRGYASNFNVDPGPAATPIIFDAPPQLATVGTLELWLGTYGGSDWKGADVYVSSDNVTYKRVGQVTNPACMGTLTAALALGSDPDTTDTLAVTVAVSGGALLSGTQADADAFNTLCWVSGEMVSYKTALLTGTGLYSLSYLRRGGYGTSASAHAAGASFLRCNNALFRYGYTVDQIGKTIYVKLVSFNHWDSYGEQELSSVTATAYTIQGPPPPPNVTGFTAQQNGGAVAFNWDPITSDYAVKGYDIAYGPMGTTLWAQMTILTEAAAGTEMTNASVPPGNWVFAIRARDIANQLSPTMATISLTVSNASSIITQAIQGPEWTGTLTGFVKHYTGVLIPDSTVTAAAMTQALAATWDADPVAVSTYTTAVIDTGVVDQIRVSRPRWSG